MSTKNRKNRRTLKSRTHFTVSSPPPKKKRGTVQNNLALNATVWEIDATFFTFSNIRKV